MGRKIKLTLAEAITVSSELVSSSTSTITSISEVQDSIQTTTTLPPQTREQYLEELGKIKTDVEILIIITPCHFSLKYILMIILNLKLLI